MKLQELFSALPVPLKPAWASLDATSLTQDARKAVPGSVFVAVPGTRADGHDFLGDAVRGGAIALVVEDASRVPAEFSGETVVVPSTSAALDLLAARWAGQPGRDMYCVGVTGTNGKTSLTYLIEHLFNVAGKPTGVIGTIDHHLGGKTWPSDMTTPDPILLQARLREMKDAGAAAVAMEISSHALDQRRADSVPFDAAVFTNLTQDHLDYHKTFEHYFAAKERLFTDLLERSEKKSKYAIVHADDPWGARLRSSPSATKWTYGEKGGHFRYQILEMGYQETRFALSTPVGSATVVLPMGGAHNVQNATAALAVAVASGIPLESAASSLKNFRGVPGRLQQVDNKRGLSVFVDYAHSPDAIDNVLGALGKIRANAKTTGRIWTVFGCGGDRDKAKRPLMAASALRGSDFVVITSDNPRTENPDDIIRDIRRDIGSEESLRVHVDADRAAAIRWALGEAKAGDVVLIAGKGHEDYQIIGTEKRHFSDFEVAREFLEGLKK